MLGSNADWLLLGVNCKDLPLVQLFKLWSRGNPLLND